MKVNERKIIKLFHGFLLLLPIVILFIYCCSIFKSNVSISDIFSNYSNFITSNLTFNFLNFNNIVDWINTNMFSSQMPIIFNVVILHIIYYCIVEILILIFDVLFFIVHYARKWIGGFYA